MKKYIQEFKKYISVVAVNPALETFKMEAKSWDLIYIDLMVKKLPQLVKEQGVSIDTEIIKSLSKAEIKHRLEVFEKVVKLDGESDEADKYLFSENSRQYLFSYLASLGRSIVLNIYSTSYISSLVLMRGFIELLIGIATKKSDSFTKAIESISFLTNEEKRDFKASWNNLCGWSHPYGKWLKEICPIFELNTPKYNEKLFIICFECFMSLVDIMIIIVIEKYEIKFNKFIEYIFDPFTTGIEFKNLLPHSRKRYFKNCIN